MPEIFPQSIILPIARIGEYSSNARTHSPAQISQIAASIAQFGWTNPVLVDEHDTLIAGHGRLAAARQLGMAEVPAIVIAGLNDTQKRALRLADNKLAINAGWDDDLLRTELADLRDTGFDLALTGFGEMEIGQLFAPETDAAAEWQGMPEFEQADQQSFRSIVVHFQDQAAVDAFAAVIGQSLTAKTKFTWFPQLKREDVADQRYIDATPFPNLHPIERAA